MSQKAIKNLRIKGGELLGRELTQPAAGELVHNERAWYRWEKLGTMPLAVLELFCIKTGLKFDPKLLEGKTSPKKERRQSLESEVEKLKKKLKTIEERRIQEKEELINTVKILKKLI